MPVTLYRVDQPVWDAEEQVRIDLTRIYADAPENRIQLSPGAYVTQHLARGFFLAARFNDRLLGAVAVYVDGDAWRLSDLCVRKTTRRRGVGSRLMALISAEAGGKGMRLRVDSAQLEVADQVLLQRMGYHLTRTGDYFELVLPTGDSGR
ncbi:acetyl-CoA sensor PanZ family protein [Halomonas binhaiensis]|uniref:Acetyl-CoA sensor PanZ family protein n=1 Tax=Halomonas binhaiensis TaxID=2562282 RepID=A0A5C1NCI4_9GAMM|nr:acetyl-CoA sensor PanZ family protein [Halomonas binhaiensis]QEM80178.1 acetyl-CoA sensor PanZ family protein [Halomonas binhaiensis]